MEGFLNRYRNITVLLLVIFAQLLLLAYQVRNDQDVRMIRVWTVTGVTPVARFIEGLRSGSLGFIRDYVMLHNADQENRRLREEVGHLKLENISLKNDLNRADRAKALELFQSKTPSKMVAATVIATGTGLTSKVVTVDRGTSSGVMRGMAVVTPDGIVGKVIAAYPTASEVLLVTDPDFAAGVVSQKNQARGTLKGEGTPLCKVDYVPSEQKVEVGEWFYTSGDDRIFPRGFQAGIVRSVKPGQPFQEILVEPSGIQHGLEDVLILVQAVHQDIPEASAANQPVYIAPGPPGATGAVSTGDAPATTAPAIPTEADKLRAAYKSVGDAQGIRFGDNGVGAKPPDFTKLPDTGSGQPARTPAGATGATAATGTTAVRPPTPQNKPAAAGATGPTAARPSTTLPRPSAGTPPGPREQRDQSPR